jgi:hypothetical protein
MCSLQESGSGPISRGPAKWEGPQPRKKAAGNPEPSQWLVSPKLLEHAKLEIVWAESLPMKKKDSLERLFILDNRIYADLLRRPALQYSG